MTNAEPPKTWACFDNGSMLYAEVRILPHIGPIFTENDLFFPASLLSLLSQPPPPSLAPPPVSLHQIASVLATLPAWRQNNTPNVDFAIYRRADTPWSTLGSPGHPSLVNHVRGTR